jgi:hypothetical protein
MKKFTKTWELRWNDCHIVVINWWDWTGRGGEELIIDGQIVTHHKSSIRFSRDLESTFFSAGEKHRVRAHIGSTDFGFKVGCHIFVDDVLVGGDIHKKIIT